VLLAIAWPTHQHHHAARAWILKHAQAGWATCAVTELGFVRLSSSPAFTRNAVGPLDAIELLGQLREVGRHRFWETLPSVLELEGLPLIGHHQLTDALLVRLVEGNEARVVTFDGGPRQYATVARAVQVLGG
jgi:hypothetical protein